MNDNLFFDWNKPIFDSKIESLFFEQDWTGLKYEFYRNKGLERENKESNQAYVL